MNKLQIVLILFVGIFIKSGYSIKCYTCESPTTPGCKDIKKNKDIKSEDCSPEKIGQSTESGLKDIAHIQYFKHTGIEVLMVCQKIIATNNYTKETFINRGCQLDGGNTDLCAVFKLKAKPTNLTIDYCTVCKDDDCNSATRLHGHMPRLQMISIFGFITLLYTNNFI